MQEKLTESFTKFEAASQWKEHHEDYSRSFLNSDQQKNVFFWVDENAELQVSHLLPRMFYGKYRDSFFTVLRSEAL